MFWALRDRNRMKKRVRRLLLLSLALLLFLCGCGGGGGSQSAPTAAGEDVTYPYQVVTTVGMISDIVREIADTKAEVKGLIGEGVDPHLYSPTRSDVVALQAADVIFYNGLMLEGKMSDVLVSVASKGKVVHAVTEAIRDQGDYVMTDESDHLDPHVWMDVKGWMKAVNVVREGLIAFDPNSKSGYEDRADAFLKQLEALDEYAKASVQTIPEKQRVLVTAHDAFGYMGRAYGLEVKGIQGMSTESEAGVKDIEDLVTFLIEHKIPAVFVESSVADKNVRALLEGAKSRGHTVAIGGELFSDAMGPAGSYEGSYIGMIDHNITTLVRALGGQAPEKGLNGRLRSAKH